MSSTVSLDLAVTLLDYWHAGGGSGAAFDLDAVVDKDAYGLPCVRGRMLKGLLRDAIFRAEQWGVLFPVVPAPVQPSAPRIAEILFGSAGFDQRNVARNETTPGALRIEDARLPAVERETLEQRTFEDLRRRLYREVFGTEIEHNSGTAKSRSLRGIEVTIPLELRTRLHWSGDPASILADSWHLVIERCLPLVRALGAQRSRGLGRSELRILRGGSATGIGASS